MYIGLSKTFARFGKFRIGAGLRVTKSNAIFMLIVLCFVYMMQAAWYLCVFFGWLTYIMFYWLFRLCLIPFKLLKNIIINVIKNKINKDKGIS